MTVREPFVSVVMTVYNDGRYVRQAVASILSQSFRDYEFIIVDDGAIDDSFAQVAAIRDPRIRLIRQANQGLAAALNRGIADARGDFIARQDADDFSTPDRLERQVSYLQENPLVGLISSDINIVSELGQLLLVRRCPRENVELQQRLLAANQFFHGAAMFRKDVAVQAGLYRPAFRRCQDYDLWLRIAEVAQVANLPHVLYNWRLRRGSVATSHWSSHDDHARLALRCAHARRAGKPEPELTVESVTRGWFIALTSAFRTVADPTLTYEMMAAQMLLLAGRGAEARCTFLRVMCASPLTLYAWLLFVLSLLPTGAVSPLWHGLRALYRIGTWKD